MDPAGRGFSNAAMDDEIDSLLANTTFDKFFNVYGLLEDRCAAPPGGGEDMYGSLASLLLIGLAVPTLLALGDNVRFLVGGLFADSTEETQADENPDDDAPRNVPPLGVPRGEEGRFG